MEEQEIKDHEYFKDLNWEDVENRRIQPVFVPKVDDNIVPSNFDTDFTRQEFSLQDSQKNCLDFETFYDKQFEGFSYFNPDFVR